MSLVPPIERQATARTPVITWRDGRTQPTEDTLAVEEPLEIRLAGLTVAVTMRTPGDDLDLAAGFLFTEGIIRGPHDIASLEPCPTDAPDSAGNIVNLNPTDPAIVDPSRWQRNFYATSSCGICGKASIATLHQRIPPLHPPVPIPASTLLHLTTELRRAQSIFHQTGGLHAAALFDRGGHLLAIREDIGRHNALDKLIGSFIRTAQLPLSDHILLVSSRASFEIVQKALMAGIPIVAAVSAASSLAVDLARSTNLTLIGFLRSDHQSTARFTIYTGGHTILD